MKTPLFAIKKYVLPFIVFTILLFSFQNCTRLQSKESPSSQDLSSTTASASSTQQATTAAKVDPTQMALDIYSRLTGLRASLDSDIIAQMTAKVSAGDLFGAAQLATQDHSFYNITVRDFAAKMSNRDETINVNLNDFTATVIGAVRDDLSAQTLLTGNYYYQGDPAKVPTGTRMDQNADIVRSTNHYDDLTTKKADYANVLVSKPQVLFNGSELVVNDVPAGLLTTRQWMAAHAVAGTNRRMIEFTFREFLCIPIEKWADASNPDNFVGRDVDRFPGGSHTKYTTTCRACHSNMDSLRGAFARYTFSNNFVKNAFLVPNLSATANEDNSVGMRVASDGPFVSSKYNQNTTVFPGGRVVTDDYFENNAIRGANISYFGWTGNLNGYGPNDFGKMIAGAKAFPRCMAQRVFKSVCKRDPASSDDAMISQVTTEFMARNYNLKYLFQRIVTQPECLGSTND